MSSKDTKLSTNPISLNGNNCEDTINLLNAYGSSIMTVVGAKEIPMDIMFPDELNVYLREQIQYYAHENAMVKKNLSDLESDYEKSRTRNIELEQSLKSYESVLNKSSYVTSNQVATAKIVELTKKCRQKTSEVESLRAKCSKLEKHILELNYVQEDILVAKPEIVKRPSTECVEENKKLLEKLNQANYKLIETRNLNLLLKNDLKMANKWLQQEIGETFESLTALNGSNGNWRGRAQIIVDLQRKNCELRERIRASQEKLNTGEVGYSQTESRISLLSKENEDLNSKYEDLKKKYEGVKTRSRVLDNDIALLKSKINTLKEQSETDQKFIETLSSQLSNKNLELEKSQKDRLLKKLQTERNQLMKEVGEYKNVVKGLKQTIDNRDKEVEQLKKQKQDSTTRCLDDTGINMTPELQKLLDYMKLQEKRLSDEREAHNKTHLLLRIEKQKATKAEALAAKLELDSNRSGNYSNSNSLKLVDSTLRDQLELAQENLKALQTRLEIEQFERKSDLQEFAELLQMYEKQNMRL